jgi:hypothetical protein
MVPALRSALPTDVLVLLQRSKSIAEASVQLEAAPVRTIVLHNVPTSQATAMRIHGSAAVMLPDSYFASLREASGQVFRALPPDQVVDLTSIQASNDSSIAAWVARRVQGQHRDELTVLIGHIDGGAVAFPDGSHLPLGVVDELGGSGSHGQIWIIGCNTLLDLTPKDAVSFGTGRRITYTEALHTAGIVASEANRGSSYRDILLKVQNDRTSTYAIGLVGTGIVLMQRPECREEKPCK